METGSVAVDQDLQSQIAFFESKRQLNPESRAFAPLADLYRRAGRLDDALRILAEGLERHPEFVSALVILGRVHADREDGDAARAAWQKVMALDPENLVALRQLAIDAGEREAWRPAVTLWERYVHLNPIDADAEDQLRTVRQELEQTAAEPPLSSDDEPPAEEPAARAEEAVAEAAASAAAAVAPGGESPALRSLATRTLAEIFLAQGYRDKAVAVLQEILEHDPARADVRTRLDEIRAERRLSGADESAYEPSAGETSGSGGPAGAPERAGVAGGQQARRRTSERAAEREQFENWIARIRQRRDNP